MCICHRGMQGHPGVCLRIIYTACYTDWVFTLLTTCQLSVVNSCMTHGYGHLQVLTTGGAYNEGGWVVYQTGFVKYKALFMTRMTGMTRNMKLAATLGQQTKFQKSCHSCHCCHEMWKLKEINFLCYTLNFINIFFMENMLTRS